MLLATVPADMCSCIHIAMLLMRPLCIFNALLALIARSDSLMFPILWVATHHPGEARCRW